jgi:sterol desaturase/sphingolipid hydroxylase (fatty acid hydroxylase superfamily)
MDLEHATLQWPLYVAVAAFVLAALSEHFYFRRRRSPLYDRMDARASAGVAIGYVLTAIATSEALKGLYDGAFAYRLFDIPHDAWWSWLVLFVLVDFLFYVFHRLSHRCRWLWASHAVHHSAQTVNFSTAYRLPWTGFITGAFLFWLVPVLIGFPPDLVFFVVAVDLIYQFWLHTPHVRRLGPLEWVFNTPSHHRVHHAINPRCIDRNYGGVLIVFDRLFGTFVPEIPGEELRYGLVGGFKSHNPILIAFHEWIAMARDLLRARGAREVLGYLFAPPGWRPRASRA